MGHDDTTQDLTPSLNDKGGKGQQLSPMFPKDLSDSELMKQIRMQKSDNAQQHELHEKYSDWGFEVQEQNKPSYPQPSRYEQQYGHGHTQKVFNYREDRGGWDDRDDIRPEPRERDSHPRFNEEWEEVHFKGQKHQTFD